MDWRIAGDPAELKFEYRKGEVGSIGACVTSDRDALNLSEEVTAKTHIGFTNYRAQDTADFRRRIDCTITNDRSWLT
ncbi:unnamed protein product [Gongylonema pulchrum]|uniref:DUF4440 domain-containing protein n=1 Tax=Gongylonema pulchrum TaxID=637853 RepID=A0A183DR28_9BILA|nr:unnamed protein product [Gongylonema pulchrum]